MNYRIFPSLLSAEHLQLKNIISDLEMLVDGFHIDVMDDHFVPNLGFSIQCIKEISAKVKKPLWIHLMVDNPKKWLSRDFLFQKKDLITIHHETIESGEHAQKTLITQFKQITPHIGIALNNETPLKQIIHLFSEVDHILLMTVKPGFGGQTFLETAKEKIKELAQIKKEKKYKFRIAIDGGITFDIFQEFKKLVDDFAIGSGIFKYQNYIDYIERWYTQK